jgi:endonuclease YncB( thermonuclease family)
VLGSVFIDGKSIAETQVAAGHATATKAPKEPTP